MFMWFELNFQVLCMMIKRANEIFDRRFTTLICKFSRNLNVKELIKSYLLFIHLRKAITLIINSI